MFPDPTENEEKNHQRIFYVRQTIRNRPKISETARNPMISRVHSCIDSGRKYFVYFL
jgi:hypothetical protein